MMVRLDDSEFFIFLFLVFGPTFSHGSDSKFVINKGLGLAKVIIQLTTTTMTNQDAQMDIDEAPIDESLYSRQL